VGVPRTVRNADESENGTAAFGSSSCSGWCFLDWRGFFSRFFCREDFAALGCDFSGIQINHTLTPDCQLLYLHGKAYAPGFEGGLNALDPAIGIDWPQPAGQMPARDQNFAMLGAHLPGED
jgi:dTDP-4-dehydrorhamnose 3,5-epimerase-like enzyme